MQITPRQQELLDLLQEECAEVIQQISKVRRFGPDFRCHGGRDDSCIDLLTSEVYDMLFFVHELVTEGILPDDPHGYDTHRTNKIERLKKWSTLYVDADN